MVGTPIGNLEDITLRALKTLKEVDVIACEDTRHTSNLLTHFDIKKRLIACHSYNEEESAKGIISLLECGILLRCRNSWGIGPGGEACGEGKKGK